VICAYQGRVCSGVATKLGRNFNTGSCQHIQYSEIVFFAFPMFLIERILSTGVVQDKEKTVKSRNAHIFSFIDIISFLLDRI